MTFTRVCFLCGLTVALLTAVGLGAVGDEPAVEPVELEFEAVEDPAVRVQEDRQRSGHYPPPTFSTPGGLPPEIQKIQQDLGGSVVNQFPSLQPSEAPRASSPTAASRERLIAAFRDAAWSMDSWANRLESLEAYEQADALRAHAQRLRLAARAQVASPSNDASDSQPAPTFEPAPTVEISPATPRAEPTELR